MHSRTILVAPLHWGLGHATRCIPIVQRLLRQNFNVIIASDGNSLELLRLEFPDLPFIHLPSYNITYPKNGIVFKWNLLLQIPKIIRAISEEKKVIDKLILEGHIDGIISDNRYGVRNKNVPSVLVTHQLNVLSGTSTFLSSYLQQYLLKKFDQCWVPDVSGKSNFSGRLGHLERSDLNIKYLGLLSRMKRKELPITIDILAILSGPEPQRSLLESKLIETLEHCGKNVLIIQGLVSNEQVSEQKGSITQINFMTSAQLEKTINESKIIISRPGYTTIMDLAVMKKNAYFIPTPGQYEQEYLAKRLKEQGMAPYCKQSEFTFHKLKDIKDYVGLSSVAADADFRTLFRFFEGK